MEEEEESKTEESKEEKENEIFKLSDEIFYNREYIRLQHHQEKDGETNIFEEEAYEDFSWLDDEGCTKTQISHIKGGDKKLISEEFAN